MARSNPWPATMKIIVGQQWKSPLLGLNCMCLSTSMNGIRGCNFFMILVLQRYKNPRVCRLHQQWDKESTGLQNIISFLSLTTIAMIMTVLIASLLKPSRSTSVQDLCRRLLEDHKPLCTVTVWNKCNIFFKKENQNYWC